MECGLKGQSGCVGQDEVGGSRLTALVKLIRVVKLVKLLKLFRLLKVTALLAEIRDHYPVPEIAVKGVQMVTVIIFAGHITACLWYVVGRINYTTALDEATRMNSTLTRTVSWLQVAALEPANPLTGGLLWDEVGPPYVASFYWAFTTMTSTGYGDLSPMSEGERRKPEAIPCRPG